MVVNVRGTGYGLQGTGGTAYQIQGRGCWVKGTGGGYRRYGRYRVQGTRYGIQGTRYGVQGTYGIRLVTEVHVSVSIALIRASTEACHHIKGPSTEACHTCATCPVSTCPVSTCPVSTCPVSTEACHHILDMCHTLPGTTMHHLAHTTIHHQTFILISSEPAFICSHCMHDTSLQSELPMVPPLRGGHWSSCPTHGLMVFMAVSEASESCWAACTAR